MELNEKYRIIYDSENTILQFFEQRENKKKEIVEFTENFYYPSLKSALIGFLTKCTWGVDDAKEVLRLLNEVELIINKIKNEFRSNRKN